MWLPTCCQCVANVLPPYVATTLPHCYRVVTALPLDVNTLRAFVTALPWSFQWSRWCCHQVALCLYHVATEASAERQYVVSPITHTNLLDLLQCLGNVEAISGCDCLASTILASVNGALQFLHAALSRCHVL